MDDIDRGTTYLDAQAEAMFMNQGVRLHQHSEWPEPLPLLAKSESEPYPLDALPERLRAAVLEVQGFTKTPVAMVAASALSALSLATQAHIDVQRAERLAGPVSLYLLTIADSGERKSTNDGFFTSAIREYEEVQAEQAKAGQKAYRAELSAFEAKRAGLVDAIKQAAKSNKDTAELEAGLRHLEDEEPVAPRFPRLSYGDATPEALIWSLAKNWPSGGVLSSEAGAVFGAHGMGSESIMRNLAALNVLWDGGALPIDRKKEGGSFRLHGVRLTTALQVQEATLRAFFSKSGDLARGTGFLARFLVSWPASTQGKRFFTDPPASWPALATFNRAIAAILNTPPPIQEDGSLSPTVLTLAPDAKAMWIAFHDAIEIELQAGGELFDVRDVASKTADNAARLAALLQVFERGFGGAVSLASFESAARIVAWHLGEARRFFGELALPADLANAMRLDAWLLEYCRRERTHMVPRREVQRCGPSGVRDKTALDAALRELADAGRVRVVNDARRKEILVNPALIDGGTQ